MKKYFLDISNLISFALGLIPAFAFFVLKPMLTVPLWFLLVVISILCIFIWLFIKSRIELHDVTTQFIQIIECVHGVCLCKPNNLITYSSWVMFYECSGEYENKIAFGKVETITQKGVAQIAVYPIDETHENILAYINNEKSKIIVRPTITTEAIQIINKSFLEV